MCSRLVFTCYLKAILTGDKNVETVPVVSVWWRFSPAARVCLQVRVCCRILVLYDWGLNGGFPEAFKLQ